MGVGVSLLLISAGAMPPGPSQQTSGIDLNTVGLIAIVVGGLGLVLRLSSGRVGPHGRASQGRESGPRGATVTEDASTDERCRRPSRERGCARVARGRSSRARRRPARANSDLDAYAAPGLRPRLHEATERRGSRARRRRPEKYHVHRLGGPRRPGRGAQADAGAGGRLRIVRPPALVARAFEVTGLDEVLDMRDDREQALEGGSGETLVGASLSTFVVRGRQTQQSSGRREPTMPEGIGATRGRQDAKRLTADRHTTVLADTSS